MGGGGGKWGVQGGQGALSNLEIINSRWLGIKRM